MANYELVKCVDFGVVDVAEKMFGLHKNQTKQKLKQK